VSPAGATGAAAGTVDEAGAPRRKTGVHLGETASAPRPLACADPSAPFVCGFLGHAGPSPGQAHRGSASGGSPPSWLRLDRLLPGALEVIARLRRHGPTVLLSDGDVVFQPRKVERSGLAGAVRGHVLIYVHKEQELADVARRYPADRYVFVDDKPRLLAAFKRA
jgi:hypothetical protein